MRVCDKCRKNGVSKVLKMEDKDIDLCDECYNHIKNWLNTPLKQTFLQKLLGGGK